MEGEMEEETGEGSNQGEEVRETERQGFGGMIEGWRKETRRQKGEEGGRKMGVNYGSRGRADRHGKEGKTERGRETKTGGAERKGGTKNDRR